MDPALSSYSDNEFQVHIAEASRVGLLASLVAPELNVFWMICCSK